MEKFGLAQAKIDKIIAIFKSHSEIKKVILYGSRAKNTHKNYSDIDLTLVGETINLSVLLQIENELDDLLLPQKMDISILNHIKNEDLLAHIRNFGVVMYEKLE